MGKVARHRSKTGICAEAEQDNLHLWNRMHGLGEQVAHLISRRIVEFAKTHGATILVARTSGESATGPGPLQSACQPETHVLDERTHLPLQPLQSLERGDRHVPCQSQEYQSSMCALSSGSGSLPCWSARGRLSDRSTAGRVS